MPPDPNAMQPFDPSANIPPSLVWSPVSGSMAHAYALPPGVALPVRAFQFSSLQHLDARIEELLRDVQQREALQPSTVRWLRDGYRALRVYLLVARAEPAFLSGDFVKQRDVLTSWTGWLIARGISRVTVRTHWRALASLCRRLEAADGLSNPFRWLPAPRVGRLLPKSLTRDAARTVLLFVRNYSWESRFARDRNTAMVGCMLLAGLRRSEVMKLRCEDVEEASGIIHIRHGKGRDGGKDRTAYVPPQLQDMLARYRRERASVGRGTPAFFSAIRRDAPIGGGAIRRLFDVISSKTTIHVSPHMLRHTYATLLRQAGIADRVSMDLLGHAHLATLQRYSHVFEPEYLHEVGKLSVDLS
jgi:integrase